MNNLIIVPHIRVQNANAFSSPFTVGFPAMTAWLGATHALQRHLNASSTRVTFSAVGIVSHDFELQIYRGPGDYVNSIIGTGNPLEPKPSKDKPKGNAVRPSFIEEPRCHLEISLVIEYEGIEAQDEQLILDEIQKMILSRMKLAGGDVLGCKEPKIVRDFNAAKRELMPGYALIERRDLMKAAMSEGLNALDAILEYLAIHHSSTKEIRRGEEHILWQSNRKSTGPDGQAGWIVPIASGFHAVSDLDQALNQRDPTTPHRFAESIVTLGEFKMPYRFDTADDLLWQYNVELENNLYLCSQRINDLDLNDDY